MNFAQMCTNCVDSPAERIIEPSHTTLLTLWIECRQCGRDAETGVELWGRNQEYRWRPQEREDDADGLHPPTTLYFILFFPPPISLPRHIPLPSHAPRLALAPLSYSTDLHVFERPATLVFLHLRVLASSIHPSTPHFLSVMLSASSVCPSTPRRTV